MEIEVAGVDRLRLADGSPVRAASAVAPLGDGYLVAQDDAHPCGSGSGGIGRRRPPPAGSRGLDVFDEASGTKHLKPDFEAACAIEVEVLRRC